MSRWWSHGTSRSSAAVGTRSVHMPMAIADGFVATGVWTGQAQTGSDRLVAQLNLVEAFGAIEGALLVGDPEMGIVGPLGAVTGERTDGTVALDVTGGIQISGVFSDAELVGTLTMPGDTGDPAVTADLRLQRTVLGLGLMPITPTRVLDTRRGDGYGYYEKPLAGDIVSIRVNGLGGLPDRGVAAIVANLTGTEATAAGYVTVWADGQPQPATSNLNLEAPGQTLANLCVIPVGSYGGVQLFTQSGTHLVLDVLGWFPANSVLQIVPPTRLLDTRAASAIGFTGDKPGPGGIVKVPVAGVAGVAGAGVGAAVINLTGTEANGAGYVTAWPSGQPQPTTSNLNLERVGQTLANLAVVPVGDDGAINLYTQTGTHLIVDVLGWFPRQVPAGPIVPLGNLVRDGSFDPWVTINAIDSYKTYALGALGSWTITDKAVDLVGPNQGTAFKGTQFVDLNGNGYGPGTLDQLVPTSPGRRYAVSFMLAGNPNGAPTVKTLDVTFGTVTKSFSFDVTGHTNAALGWTLTTFEAEPDCGGATLLRFKSTTTGDRGPNIDHVSVTDIGPGESCQPRGYTAFGPVRLLDTRTGERPGAGAVVKVPIVGANGVPSGGISAVVVNLTGTEAVGAGYVTAWPSGTTQPETSNLNLERAGQTLANCAVVAVGPDGAISLFTQTGTHLIVDLFGWFSI